MCFSRRVLGVVALLGAVTFAFSQAASAGSIAVSFGADANGGVDPVLEVGDAAGVNGETDWNNGLGASDAVGITDNGITVTCSSSESWNQASTDNSGDTELMSGWISQNDRSTDGGKIDVTGLPALYDLYVYIGHDRSPNDVQLGESNGAFADMTIAEDVTFASLVDPFVYNQGDGAGGAGNYLLVSGLTAATLNLTFGSADGANRAGVVGVQIVEVPEPSGIILSVIGLVGLCSLRRRKRCHVKA